MWLASPLSQGRELKSPSHRAFDEDQGVAPLAGARIEMFEEAVRQIAAQVAPLAGARIEITAARKSDSVALSRPSRRGEN